MKLYKFIYDLGVKQERQRIKNEIIEMQRYESNRMNTNNNILRDDDSPKKSETLKRQIAVDSQVLAILDRLTTPLGSWVQEENAPIDGGISHE